MSNLIEIFERSSPEIVFEWTDTETEAKGWVVINSLRGGAAVYYKRFWASTSPRRYC
jgi:hypothetical protein